MSKESEWAPNSSAPDSRMEWLYVRASAGHTRLLAHSEEGEREREEGPPRGSAVWGSLALLRSACCVLRFRFCPAGVEIVRVRFSPIRLVSVRT
jgi:hypothetical protein